MGDLDGHTSVIHTTALRYVLGKVSSVTLDIKVLIILLKLYRFRSLGVMLAIMIVKQLHLYH